MGVTILCSLFLWTATFSLPFSLNVVPASALSATLKFKDGTVCSSIHSLIVPKSIECRWQYFLLAYRWYWAVLYRIPNRNILYLVVASFKRDIVIPKPLLKIKFFSARVCIDFVKVRYTNSLKTVNINFKHKNRKFVRDFWLQNCPSCDRIKSEHNSLLFVCQFLKVGE